MNIVFLLEGVLMLPTAVIGMLLNVASIFYFATCHYQRPFHRLLMTLAGVDTMYLITSSLSFSLKQLSIPYQETVYNLVVPYTLPIAQTTMTASVYLTLSLTVERYFSIVKPLYQLRNRWLRSSFLLAIPGIVFSILFTLPNYFMISTVWRTIFEYAELPPGFQVTEEMESELRADNSSFILVTSPEGDNLTLAKYDNKTLQVIGQSYVTDIEVAEFRDNEIYTKVYVMWLHFIFNSILPLSILVTLNTAIYRKLSTLPDQMRRSAEQSLRRRELRLARVSLLIVFIFLLCHTPKVLPSIFEIAINDIHLIPGLVEVSHLLLTINSSVNFLVYYLACGRNICNLFSTRGLERTNTRMSQREQLTTVSNLNDTLTIYHHLPNNNGGGVGGGGAVQHNTLHPMNSFINPHHHNHNTTADHFKAEYTATTTTTTTTSKCQSHTSYAASNARMQTRTSTRTPISAIFANFVKCFSVRRANAGSSAIANSRECSTSSEGRSTCSISRRGLRELSPEPIVLTGKSLASNQETENETELSLLEPTLKSCTDGKMKTTTNRSSIVITQMDNTAL